MKLISKIVVGIVFCSMTMPLVAQQMEEPKSLLSPNVATLGSFREPEVALYTGTPSISIPLFEVPLQDYVLPIELQYNGTSILVDQPPSWVGLGWNLSAGGVITRKVNDIEDDHRFTAECYESLPTGYHDDGFYYRCTALDTSNWYLFYFKQDSLYLANQDTYPIGYDTEPDEFSFSFPGYSGKFYLNHHQEWIVQCDKSVSVQLISTTMYPPFPMPRVLDKCKKQPDCFAGFIITIEDGTQFVFGNDTSAIDFCTDFFTEHQIMAANAWHLTKIILPSKQEITFTYQRQSFTNQMYHALIRGQEDLISGSTIHPSYCNLPIGDYGKWTSVSGKLLSQVYLKSIHTPSLSVTFSNSIAHDLQYQDAIFLPRLQQFDKQGHHMPYVTNFNFYEGQGYAMNSYLEYMHQNLKRYKLDSIIVTSSTFQRKVRLNYIENDFTRLALSEILFADNSAYHFHYYRLSDLPHYLSYKTDHWGYFNNDSTLNFNISDTSAYYSKLEPNSSFSNYGMLTAIYYPTGGVTRLEYESNDYQKQVALVRWSPLESFLTTRYGGGVRIRKISHYENENNEEPSKIREFFYKTNYLTNPLPNQESSGILGKRFKYYYDHYLSIPESSEYVRRRVFSLLSILPGCGDNGTVCYSEVTEKLSTGGFIVYKFSNYSDCLDENPLNIFQQSQLAYGKFTSTYMRRGLLQSKTEYNQQKELIHKINYLYTPNRPIDSFVRAIDWREKQICASYSPRWVHEGSSYKIYTHTMVPDTIREVWYSASGDSIVKITQNDYNLDYQMPIKKEVFTPTDTISELYRYPFDIIEPSALNGPFANEQEEVCAGMVNNHIYLPWEVVTKRSNKVIGSTCFHYSKYSPNPQKIFYEMDSISILGITEPIASISPVSTTQKDNHYIVPAKQSCRYDSYGNVIEIVTDGIPTAYVWGFNHSYVVAKVIGITYAQVQSVLTYSLYHQLITSTNPSLTTLSSFRSAVNAIHPTAQCFTYQYNPLYGITSETDPSGHTVFYEYDSMGRLQEVYYRENNVKRVLKKYRYGLKTFTPNPQPGIL